MGGKDPGFFHSRNQIFQQSMGTILSPPFKRIFSAMKQIAAFVVSESCMSSHPSGSRYSSEDEGTRKHRRHSVSDHYYAYDTLLYRAFSLSAYGRK